MKLPSLEIRPGSWQKGPVVGDYVVTLAGQNVSGWVRRVEIDLTAGEIAAVRLELIPQAVAVDLPAVLVEAVHRDLTSVEEAEGLAATTALDCKGWNTSAPLPGGKEPA